MSAQPQPRARSDRGLTLIELVVSMAIMSLAMAMFTAGILQIYRLTNKTEALSSAQSQVHLSVMRMDREVRYATAISTPGTVAGNEYVEYLLINAGVPLCVEWRLNPTTSQLQRREWTQQTVPVPAGGWRTLAFNVQATRAFAVIPADVTFTVQRLRFTLTASAGAGQTSAAHHTDVTFAALNTSLATSSATTCSEGRLVP